MNHFKFMRDEYLMYLHENKGGYNLTRIIFMSVQ